MATASQYIKTSYTLSGLPDGRRGTEKTLCEMAKFVRTAVALPFFVDHARSIASQAPAHNQRAQVKKIFEHVSQCMYYINDPVDVEWVQGAQHTEFTAGFGDCDDAAVLIASLCGSIGIICQFIVCGFDPTDNSYEHVWAQAWIEPSQFDNGGWYDLDPCADPRTGNNVPGYYAKGATNFAVYPVWPELTTGLGDSLDDYSDGSDDFYDFGSTGDYGGGGGDFNLDDLFNFSGDTGTDSGFDPSAPLTAEEDQLFGWLQDNFGGQPLYNPSLQDLGIYQGSDGSTVLVNPDGTLSFQNSAGQLIGQLVDANGNPVSPSTISQTTGVKPQASSGGSGGGSGGGMSIPSGGAPKPATATTPTSTSSTANTIASLLNKASNAINSLVGGGTTGLHTVINPATGLPVLVNSAGQIVGSATATSTTGLSGTTLLLLAVGAAFLLKGK